MPITIYNPETWVDFHEDPRKPAMLTWLNANGINPSDVPLDHPVTIDGKYIHHTAYTRHDNGDIRTTPDGQAITEHRAVPLLQAPASELTPPHAATPT